MTTRYHRLHTDLIAPASRVFSALHTPSAIKSWWSASNAIVLAQKGGVWVATWGQDPDAPDYLTTATIAEFAPPTRLVLADFRYYAREAPLPFDGSLTTAFAIDPTVRGCRLTVIQDGFPTDPTADAFFDACGKGWQETLARLGRHVDAEVGGSSRR